jgi:hypothetical protein
MTNLLRDLPKSHLSGCLFYMDDGAKAWMMGYARRNYWRVAAWMDLDDLIQDGYYAWVEVCWRYPAIIDQPAQIMSMFKLCFADKITDLSRGKTKQQDDARSDIVDVFDGDAVTMPDPSNFNLLLVKAPKLVKDTIELMTSDRMKDELNKPYERQANGHRETLNERICRLLKLDPNSIDAVRETRMWFQPG